MSESFHSPESLLASLFSQEEKDRGLILLTGIAGSGKTTWCLKLISQMRIQHIAISGVVSPPVYDEGCKIAIDLVEITSGERRRMAFIRDGATVEPSCPGMNLGTEAWQFDPRVLEWGNEVLRRTKDSELFILDEIGPLEFLQGQGFQMGLQRVDSRRDRLAVVVVRPSLIPQAIARWPWAQVEELNSGKEDTET